MSRYNTINCDPDLIVDEVNQYLAKSIRPKSLQSSADGLTIINTPGHRVMESTSAVEPMRETETCEEETFLHNKTRLEEIAGEDPVDFELGVTYYADKYNDTLIEKIDNTKEALQQGAKNYQIDINKVLVSLKTLEDCDRLYLSIQFVKGLRFKVFRNIIMEPQKYPMDDSSGRSVKDLLKYRMMTKYLRSLEGEAKDTNFTM